MKAKKLVTLVTAVALCMGMSMTAMAAETSVDPKAAQTNPYADVTYDATAHEYTAYQIFKGEIDAESNQLINIEWGSSVAEDEGAGLIAALDEFVNGATINDAAGLAAVIAEYGNHSEGAYEIARAAYDYLISANATGATVKNGDSVDAGYYLIVDTTKELADGEAYNLSFLQVTSGEIKIVTKTDVPSFEKKVKDINDSTGEGSEWQDSADYDIGDEIAFQLTGTVASNYADYKTYSFTFHDKEENGLTFKADSVKVYVDGAEITEGYTVESPAADGDTFDVIFADLKAIPSVKAGSKISVEYVSVINEDAVIGNQGNENEAHLEYSNNPNADQKGETPKDTVIVFTYKTVINKVDQNEKPLTGATFVVEKKLADGTWKELDIVVNDEGTVFTVTGIDDGVYRITEKEAPKGYNAIEPIEFTVVAQHNENDDLANRELVLTALTATNNDTDLETGNIGTFNVTLEDGNIVTSIVNQSGSVLPSTGGIGTTIFYVVGGLLIVGAIVLLVSKKRMGNDD